jgi:hypothetical protein
MQAMSRSPSGFVRRPHRKSVAPGVFGLLSSITLIQPSPKQAMKEIP